ncbi:hypothetical protein ACQPXM_41360 (plasmid) [Kribbella sp. CA-253562]
MGDTAQRLVLLLKLLERCPSSGELADDAVLDAWFGQRSPVFGRDR